MVSANQKSTIDTHIKKKKESKHNTKVSYQITRQQDKEEGKEKQLHKNECKTINKIAIRTYMLIITLNVNGLHAPTRRHTLADWIQKKDLYICCLQETHFRPRDTYRLKVRG